MYDEILIKIDELKLGIDEILSDLFDGYVVNGFFRVVKTMTYGEMVISSLLVIMIMILVFKWLWEVLR